MLTMLANIMGTLASWMLVLVGGGCLLLLLIGLIGVAL